MYARVPPEEEDAGRLPVGLGVGDGVTVAVGVSPDKAMVPELCPLIEKLVVVECGPAVCGVNTYVNEHVAPGASVAPAQSCALLKFTSPVPPPTTEDNTCGDDARFVTTTLIGADVSPTAVVGKASVVGAIENVAVPVPDNEIVPESCPLIEKLVVVECGPAVCGTN